MMRTFGLMYTTFSRCCLLAVIVIFVQLLNIKFLLINDEILWRKVRAVSQFAALLSTIPQLIIYQINLIEDSVVWWWWNCRIERGARWSSYAQKSLICVLNKFSLAFVWLVSLFFGNRRLLDKYLFWYLLFRWALWDNQLVFLFLEWYRAKPGRVGGLHKFNEIYWDLGIYMNKREKWKFMNSSCWLFYNFRVHLVLLDSIYLLLSLDVASTCHHDCVM